MARKRLLLCMGTRPEIIKMAPVYHALRDSDIEPVVLHTGQHDEMAWPIYEFFQMIPDQVVRLTRERPSLGHLGGRLMDEIDKVIGRADVDAALVHGDTTSALMAAIASFYAGLKVGHVEAGLRSFDSQNPFPEEQNRVMISRMATWHFAPTELAVNNLAKEGVSGKGVYLVGNTIVDATRIGMDHAIDHYAGAPERSGCDVAPFIENAKDGKVVLVTAHRRENWGAGISRISYAIRDLLEAHEDVHVVWPVHANPIVRDTVVNALNGLPEDVHKRLLMTGPLNYPQMLWTLRHAWMAITDSGGIQEEAAALRVPVIVTRTTTERPEVIDAGGGVLVGTDAGKLRRWAESLLKRPQLHRKMRSVRNPFGDGHTAKAISAILHRDLIGEKSTRTGIAA